MNLYRVFFSDSFSGWHTSRWIVAAANKEQAIDLIWRYTNFTCLITDFDAEKIDIDSIREPTIID